MLLHIALLETNEVAVITAHPARHPQGTYRARGWSVSFSVTVYAPNLALKIWELEWIDYEDKRSTTRIKQQ